MIIKSIFRKSAKSVEQESESRAWSSARGREIESWFHLSCNASRPASSEEISTIFFRYLQEGIRPHQSHKKIRSSEWETRRSCEGMFVQKFISQEE